MKTVDGNKLIAAFAVLVMTFACAAVFLPPRMLIEAGDCFAIAMTATVSWIYFQEVWHRPKLEPITRTDIVMLGMAGVGIITALNLSLRLWSRIMDASILDEPVLGLMLFALTFFSALQAWIRGNWAVDGRKLLNGGWLIGIALTLGAALAGYIIFGMQRTSP